MTKRGSRVTAAVFGLMALSIAPSAEAALVEARLGGGPLDAVDPDWRLVPDGELIYDAARAAAEGVTAERLLLVVSDRGDTVLTLTEADELDEPDYPLVTAGGLELAAFAVSATFAGLGAVPVDVIVDGRTLTISASVLASTPGLDPGTLLASGALEQTVVPLPGAVVFALSGVGALLALRAARARRG